MGNIRRIIVKIITNTDEGISFKCSRIEMNTTFDKNRLDGFTEDEQHVFSLEYEKRYLLHDEEVINKKEKEFLYNLPNWHYEEENENKTYNVIIHCDNCKEYRSVYIPFGMTVKEYSLHYKCSNCGCDGLK